MNIIRHIVNDVQIAEVVAANILVSTTEDGVQLLNDLYYQGFDAIIIKAEHLAADFFDLKTKLAGDVLQKFSNRRVRLIIIGDFKNVESKSLRDFMFESNKGNLVNFEPAIKDALNRF